MNFLPHPTAPHGPMPTAMPAALSASHAVLNAGIGLFLLVIWGLIHHFLAHRHHWLEVIAKVVLIGAGTVIGVTFLVFTHLINNINDATARFLTARSGDSFFVTHHIGILSFTALIVLFFVCIATYDAIKHKRRPGNSGNGGRGWDRAEALANRWGWFTLGPLATTLPGAFGASVLTFLTFLAGSIGHILGNLVGFA